MVVPQLLVVDGLKLVQPTVRNQDTESTRSSMGCGQHHCQPWPTNRQTFVGSCFHHHNGRSHRQVHVDGRGSGRLGAHHHQWSLAQTYV